MSFILMLLVSGVVSAGKISDEELAHNLEDVLKFFIDQNSDKGLTISEFVDRYNYTLETHEVITEDGYILTLHRIPHRKPSSDEGFGNATETNSTRPAVLIVHGLLCSSPSWIFQGPNASLAFQLVDQGYDVWLANTRGNSYSNKHLVLTTDEPAFWNFSIHEIGYYDMASNIDYILNVTKVDNITYIGHSQGTTDGAILTSSRPEYNEKLNLLVMLSPVIYLTQVRSLIVRFIEKHNELIKEILQTFGIYGIQRGYLGLVAETVCSTGSPLQELCVYFLGSIAGHDGEQIDRSKLQAFFAFTPSGASYKSMDHYLQQMPSGTFRQFDYGDPTKNYEHYESAVPPSYDIAQISAPTALYYSKNDYFVGLEDAEKFISELKTEIADSYLLEFDKFSHLDFIMAKDVKTLLYDRIVGVIKKYSPLSGI